jgi:hypothetical protein
MYAVGALIGLMLLTWGAAIWASFRDEPGKDETGTVIRMSASGTKKAA